MKRRLLYLFSTLLCCILILNGCKKGEPVFKFPKGEQSTCRLLTWHGLDDGYQRNLHYNQNGLLDEWYELAPLADVVQLSTFEYDHNGRVSLMKYYDHDTLVNNVVPQYSHGRLAGETWNNKNTGAMEDSVVTTYDVHGRIIRRESIPFAYYTEFSYDVYGNNLTAVIRFSDGSLYDSLTQGYDQPVREPMVAVPGLEYPINYINYIVTPLKYTSYIDMYPDGSGGFVTEYQLDPSQSQLVAGTDHFAASYFTFDLVSGVGNHQVWGFDNCGCNNNKSATEQATISNSITVKPGVARKTHRPFITMMEIRKRAIEHRLQSQRPAIN
jgi:hypothetical protein